MTEAHASASAGGGGCLGMILFFILVWVLIFGVTWNGIHYAIECNTDTGVNVSKEVAK